MAIDDRLTNSQRLCYMSCPQMHRWRYVELIRPTEDGKALRMGSAFHFAMEALNESLAWQPPWSEAPLQAAMDAIWRVYGPLAVEGRDYDYELHAVKAMVSGYAWRWQDAPWYFEAVEQVLEGPIRNPQTGRPMQLFRNAGKVDGIVRAYDGSLAVLEYKTTSDDLAADSFLWQQYGLSPQPLNYLTMARLKGYDVQRVIYDVVRKPGLRPKQIPVLDEDGQKVVLNEQNERVYLASGKPRQSADTAKGYRVLTEQETAEDYGLRVLSDMYQQPERYFARREIPVLHHDEQGAAYDTWATAKNIAQAYRDDRWPKNTNHCGAYGRCAYLPLCLSGYDPGDPLPEGFMRSTTAHPEIDA